MVHRPPHLFRAILNVPNRLIEYAANYFDLTTFPDGETKRALQRAWNKRTGKVDGSRGKVSRKQDAQGDGRDPKKRKV